MTRINLIFRLDDYSTISDSEFEKRLLSLMERYHIPCTFGIIPFVYEDEWDPSPQMEHPLTQEKIDTLKPYVKKGLVEVALHGFHHNTQAVRLNKYIPGEFFGIPQQDQENLITKGKAFLENTFSCKITTFNPPWNTYDDATLGALEKLEFTCISTGNRFGPSSSANSLSYLPALCKLSDVRPVIKKIKGIGLEEAIIVVCIHQYDFVEVSPGRSKDQFNFAKLEDLFSWIEKNKEISLYTISNYVVRDNTLTAERYGLTKPLIRNTHLVPPVFKARLTGPKFYPTIVKARKLWFHFLVVLSSYYLLLLIISMALGLIIGKPLDNVFLFVFFALAFLYLIFTIYRIYRKGKIDYQLLSLLLLSGGLTIGFLLTKFVV